MIINNLYKINTNTSSIQVNKNSSIQAVTIGMDITDFNNTEITSAKTVSVSLDSSDCGYIQNIGDEGGVINSYITGTTSASATTRSTGYLEVTLIVTSTGMLTIHIGDFRVVQINVRLNATFNITWYTGFSVYDNYTSTCYVKDNFVCLKGACKKSSAFTPGGTFTQIGSVPSAYAPSTCVYKVQRGTGVNKYTLKIDTTGKIWMRSHGTSGVNTEVAKNGFICVHINYMLG